jgi:thiamine biosynthesis lipoprotein
MTSPAPPVYRFAHQAMGTFFEVVIAGEEPGYAGQAAAAVFKDIDRLERLFSRFDPTSEIARANRLRPGESLVIGFETFECLDIAERVRADTEGAFDVNVRKPGRKHAEISEQPPIAPAGFELHRTTTGYELRIAADETAGLHPLDLDLGGIGKGYALDLAAEIIKDWSMTNALVHGGTSTALGLGPGPDGRGWPVGVGGGWPGAPTEMLLSNQALSGSGTEVKGQHVLDPRTGAPAAGHLAAWARHPSAAVADALSTAFMVMGTNDMADYCRRHPDVWALVIPSYGDWRVFP